MQASKKNRNPLVVQLLDTFIGELTEATNQLRAAVDGCDNTAQKTACTAPATPYKVIRRRRPRLTTAEAKAIAKLHKEKPAVRATTVARKYKCHATVIHRVWAGQHPALKGGK